MTFTTIFLDLDDTLYPSSTGIWDLIGERINLYMHQKVGFPLEEVSSRREFLFHKYGTTLRGLQVEFGIDPRDYLDFVHQVPIESLLQPDPRLDHLLSAIPLSRWIFTNANRTHAMRVLKTLQVNTILDGIIDILDIAPFCKPMPEAFQLALKAAGNPIPEACILVDDTPRNLAAGRLQGMYTIQVGNQPSAGAHSHIPTIHELSSVLPFHLMEKTE